MELRAGAMRHLDHADCIFARQTTDWQMDVFYTLDDVLSWTDPHQERVKSGPRHSEDSATARAAGRS
jgi:hypothetical protein